MKKEPGTYYLLTFMLCKNFKQMVIKGMLIDAYPRLETLYF